MSQLKVSVTGKPGTGGATYPGSEIPGQRGFYPDGTGPGRTGTYPIGTISGQTGTGSHLNKLKSFGLN